MPRPWNHRRCATHELVAGVGRVCVLPSQDPEAVLEFARWAAAAAVGRSIPKPGPSRSGPSPERLRHVGCSAHVDGAPWGLGRLCVARGSSVGDVLVFAAELERSRLALEAALADRRLRARELGAAGSWSVEAGPGLAAPLAEWAVA